MSARKRCTVSKGNLTCLFIGLLYAKYLNSLWNFSQAERNSLHYSLAMLLAQTLLLLWKVTLVTFETIVT